MRQVGWGDKITKVTVLG